MGHNPNIMGAYPGSQELIYSLRTAHGVGLIAIHGENGVDPDIGEYAKLVIAPNRGSGSGVLTTV